MINHAIQLDFLDKKITFFVRLVIVVVKKIMKISILSKIDLASYKSLTDIIGNIDGYQ